jgi:hypothetical protein
MPINRLFDRNEICTNDRLNFLSLPPTYIRVYNHEDASIAFSRVSHIDIMWTAALRAGKKTGDMHHAYAA